MLKHESMLVEANVIVLLSEAYVDSFCCIHYCNLLLLLAGHFLPPFAPAIFPVSFIDLK